MKELSSKRCEEACSKTEVASFTLIQGNACSIILTLSFSFTYSQKDTKKSDHAVNTDIYL